MDEVDLAFDNGLLPVVARDAETDEVLMLAYANADAVARSHETGRAHYYSRSRDELWEKGATSGHVQRIREIRVDCDGDALCYLVEQEGGACHTGYRSCFHRRIDGIEQDGEALTADTTTVGRQVFDPEAVYDE